VGGREANDEPVEQGRDEEVGFELAVLDELATELRALTQDWSAPALLRTYDRTEAGREDFEDDATVLGAHGYEATAPGVEGGHVHVGRLLLTGGFSAFAGRRGIRSEGQLTVTFRKAATAVPSSDQHADPLDQLERLAKLRDAGVVTPEEFAAKKAELLERL
jgi:Short C-terminal domain